MLSADLHAQAQVSVDQALPDQPLPDQPLPDQAEPAASALASAAVSMVRPKTSRSPVRLRPNQPTWKEPRESSSEPVPVDAGQLWTACGVGAVSSAWRCTSPAP